MPEVTVTIEFEEKEDLYRSIDYLDIYNDQFDAFSKDEITGEEFGRLLTVLPQLRDALEDAAREVEERDL